MFRLKWITLSLTIIVISACGKQRSPAFIASYSPEQAALPDQSLPDQSLPDDTFTETEAALSEASPPGASKPEVDKFKTHFDLSVSEETKILEKYQHLDPERRINDRMLKKALIFFDQNRVRLKNLLYITVVDFSLSSKMPRLNVVDIKTGSVWSMHVAQGKGSDLNGDGRLDRFSNMVGSNATSRGFYLTAETYIGARGLSLRLDGLSPTNSLARQRTIVLHGAPYVVDALVLQGRSWGCIAVAQQNSGELIKMIKGGALIYVDG